MWVISDYLSAMGWTWGFALKCSLLHFLWAALLLSPLILTIRYRMLWESRMGVSFIFLSCLLVSLLGHVLEDYYLLWGF